MGRLVMSRKVDEVIRIGDDIQIQVVDIQNGKVRIGVIAPREMPVHRQEVYEAIHGKPGEAVEAPKEVSQ